MKHRFLLLIVASLAFLTRVVGATAVPPSLYWEEAALGYDAYSILKTGKDFHGHFLPVVAFESFGDFKPSLYFYAVVPFIAAFGLSEWAVRLPSILAGTTTVIFTYLIAAEVSRNKKLAFAAGLILALLPWHLQFSRAGFEVVLATALLTAGIYALYKARRRSWFLVGAILAFVGSMYAYHGLRLLAPLLAMSLWILWQPWFYRQWRTYIAGVAAIILLLPILLTITQPQVSQRFAETSLFSVSPAVAVTNAARAADGNTFIAKVIHHRYWFWAQEILAQMLAHANPGFLFVHGDGNVRHQTGLYGLLYHWQFFPLVFGLWALFQKKYRAFGFIGIWILLATVPPALTTVSPHTLRFLPASPALAITLALGCQLIWQFIGKRRYSVLIGMAFIGVMIVDTGIYFYDYTYGYPYRSSRDWQYGYKQVVDYITTQTTPSQSVWVTREYGRPSIYFMFYGKADPASIQAQAAAAPKDQGELLAYDRFLFGVGTAETADFAVTALPQPTGTLKKTITFLDGKPAFYVYQNR